MTLRALPWPSFCLASACLLSSNILSTRVFAEDEAPVEASATSAEKTCAAFTTLPAQGDAININAGNVSQYKCAIVPEIYQHVKAGSFEFNAARKSDVEIGFDEEWKKKTQAQVESKSFSVNGALAPGARLSSGFPFGDRKTISAETDEKVLAKKILWNAASTLWAQSILNADFALTLLKSGKPMRELRGTFSRVYPHAINADDKTPQLFREIIRFTAPQPIADLAWLSFRFLGVDDDMFWMYSPSITQIRQLTASNRSDPLVRTVVTPDDFFTWSGKFEWVEPRVDKLVTGLVPLFDGKLASFKVAGADNSCTEIAVDDSSDTKEGKWNLSSQKPGLGGTLPPLSFPSSTTFIVRDMWRIELAPKDPFSFYGRQVLYVDSETFLPVYKIVYDRAGNWWKTVVGVYGFASSGDRRKKIPFNAFTLIFDKARAENDLISFTHMQACDAFSGEQKLTDFEARKLGPVIEEVPKDEQREEGKKKK